MTITGSRARCTLPPRGWRCQLHPGHSGPCPAWPAWWVRWLHRWP